MFRFAVPTLLLVALAFSACNGDDGDSASPSSTELPNATGAPAGSPGPFQGSREPVDVVTDTVLLPLLVDARTGAHADFDRVVFEFIASRPGYRVEYVDEAIACGSGMTVELEGAALLQVRMQPAAAHDDAGELTFGLQELTPTLASLLEVKQTCDFEGQVTWVLGLREEVDFAVSTLRDPIRIVVDVAHP